MPQEFREPGRPWNWGLIGPLLSLPTLAGWVLSVLFWLSLMQSLLLAGGSLLGTAGFFFCLYACFRRPGRKWLAVLGLALNVVSCANVCALMRVIVSCPLDGSEAEAQLHHLQGCWPCFTMARGTSGKRSCWTGKSSNCRTSRTCCNCRSRKRRDAYLDALGSTIRGLEQAKDPVDWLVGRALVDPVLTDWDGAFLLGNAWCDRMSAAASKADRTERMAAVREIEKELEAMDQRTRSYKRLPWQYLKSLRGAWAPLGREAAFDDKPLVLEHVGDAG